ncbi:MAG: MBOAT family protein [Proteobacteria bacterium]|nr:MBOAT family protein [Pseudomonadota bacterium]
MLLLAASYVFYGWWDWRFLGLLVFTSLFDYWCALRIEEQPELAKRRHFLTFSLLVNLTVLGLFKYFNFFADTLQHVLAVFGMKATLPVLHVILPLGISFYTFLSMSYTIDVYRRHLKAARDPLDFLLYVAFFPHLVAGPIVRATYLLPQCQRARVMVPEQVINGIWLILMGYVKKVVIADRLAGMVEWGFSEQTPPYADANNWLLLYAFTVQVYGDFSGYSDIARGVSKVMGFELPINFKAPFFVTNPTAFWQNWHISLSTWMRDYVYVPLGADRHGSARTALNLMLTMLVSGLWHGAGLAYLVWGSYYGVLLILHRAWRDLVRRLGTPSAAVRLPAQWSPNWQRAGHVVLVVWFFHITCLGMLLFRVASVPAPVQPLPLVQSYLQALFVWPTSVSPLLQAVLGLGGLATFFQWQHAKMDMFSTWPTRWQALSVILALASITALGVFQGTQFFYFQF